MSVSLSAAAAERIQSFLLARGHGVGLRLGVKKTGCSGYAYVVNYADGVDADDTVFVDRGVKVVVAADSLPFVDVFCENRAFNLEQSRQILARAASLGFPLKIHADEFDNLGGASLDVFPQEPLPAEHPLWSTPNVILTPHTSGFRPGHWDEVVDVFADNLTRWRSGRDVRFRIQPELGY